MRSNRLEKLSLVSVLCLVGAVAILVVVPQAKSFELSPYGAYPVYFWALVVGAIFVGSLVIVGSAKIPQDRTWISGLLVLLLTNGMLVLIPHIRGYRMYGRADALTHLGFVKNIVEFGGLGGSIYPPTHIVALTLSAATGTEPIAIAMMIPIVFSLVYFGSMFYLVTYLFDSRERILFGLPFIMLPVLRNAHLTFRPFDQSLMLVPLTLYAFVKSQRMPVPPVRTVFVIALVGLLLYHPLTALFMMGLFLFYLLARYAPRINERYATPTNLLSLSTAVFLAWYTNKRGIIVRFGSVYETLFGIDSGDPPLRAYQAATEQTPIALIDLFRVFTFKYGLEFVLFGLGFGFVCIVLLSMVIDREYIDSYTTMLAGVLGLFSIGGVLILLVDLIVEPMRAFQMAKIGAVILAGQLFYILWSYVDSSHAQPKFRIGFNVSLGISLMLVILLTTLSIYPSPLDAGHNTQVTEMEMEGTGWLAENRDMSVDNLVEFGMEYRRFYHAQYGEKGKDPFRSSVPPDHFNYTVHESLGESYTNTSYLTLTRLGRIFYPGTHPDYRESWRYTPRDFDRLERDRTISRIYDNGDYTQYLVRGMQQASET